MEQDILLMKSPLTLSQIQQQAIFLLAHIHIPFLTQAIHTLQNSVQN